MQTNTAKTLDQAISDWKNGKLCALLEYRSSRAEPIKWRDQNTGAILSAVTLTHGCENETSPVMVSERVPDDFDWKNYISPFKKGEKVLCNFDSASKQKGTLTLYGKLEAVDLNGGPTPTPKKQP